MSAIIFDIPLAFKYFTMRNWYISIVIIFLMSSSFAQDQDVVVKTVRTVEPFTRHVPWEIDLGETGKVEIKIKSEWGLPLVEATINGQGPFKFLFDTGADSSILSYELVKKLNLIPIETKKKIFHTAHKKAEVDTALYIIDHLKMGGAELKDAPFVASNTATDDFQVLKHLQVVGVIGANLFHDIVLTLDLGQQKVILQNHQEKGISGQKVKLEKNYYLPVVKVTVKRKDGNSDYNLLVDSGYSGFIKMPICFKYHEKPKQNEDVMTYDAFNQSEGGFISELDGILEIGDKKLDYPLVKYTLGECKDPSRWGLIGAEYLKYQSMSIDQKNRELILH